MIYIISNHQVLITISESSVPIDCSAEHGRYYVCPNGEGVPCVDGPSMLCDLKADCPGGNDELEEACGKLFFFIHFFFCKSHFLFNAKLFVFNRENTNELGL